MPQIDYGIRPQPCNRLALNLNTTLAPFLGRGLGWEDGNTRSVEMRQHQQRQ